jgi:hypothetical protein
VFTFLLRKLINCVVLLGFSVTFIGCDQIRNVTRRTSVDLSSGNYNAKIQDCKWVNSPAFNVTCSMTFRSLSNRESNQSWTLSNYQALLDNSNYYDADNFTVLDNPLNDSQSYLFQPGIPISATVNFTLPTAGTRIRKLYVGKGEDDYFEFVPVTGDPIEFNPVENAVTGGIYTFTSDIDGFRWKFKFRSCQKSNSSLTTVFCAIDLVNMKNNSREKWNSGWFSVVTPDGKKYGGAGISVNNGTESSTATAVLLPNGQLSLKVRFEIANTSISRFPYMYFETCGVIVCSEQYVLKDLPIQ